MPSFEEHLTNLTSSSSPDRSLPGVVLLAHDHTGKRVYHQCTGTTSLDPTLSRPLTENCIFWIASCTKLLTSICALQLVESGHLHLDAPVDSILPELKDLPIISGYDRSTKPQTPILKARTKPITLRHLLSHTSGLAYDFLSPLILKWWAWKGVDVAATLAGRIPEYYAAPALFEPGESWMYGPGIDWAGVMVERVSGEKRLGEYMRMNVWEKVGVREAAFRMSELGLGEEEMRKRRAHLTARLPDGRIVPNEAVRGFEPRDDLGGGGLLTSPEEYVKVLVSLLRNDGRLLRPETVDTLVYQEQLVDGRVGATAHKELLKLMGKMEGSRMLTGGYPLPDPDHANGVGGDWEYQHGLLGLLTRRRGEKQWVLNWGGLPNLFWWVDPANGLCGMYSSQIIPPADPTSLDLAVEWREEMVRRFGKRETKSNL